MLENVHKNINLQLNTNLEELLWTTISVCNEDEGTCSIPSLVGDKV